MANKSLKKGRASQNELEYIATNRNMPMEQIAEHLRRSEDFVRKAIAALPTLERTYEQGDWVSRLHASSFWVEIRRGLIGTEVAYFEKAWASYMDQFGSASDILATDELMIKDLIMLDIITQRAVIEKANVLRRIDELEKSIAAEEDKDEDSHNQIDLANWRTQLNSLYAAKAALGKEHLDCQTRKDAKLRDLKGSREQRFRQIEESRRNIFELIKELDTHKRRTQEGRLAEKVKLASQRVIHDWNQVMEFEDGTLDKPFLSPEGELEDARLQNEQEQADRQQESDDDSQL